MASYTVTISEGTGGYIGTAYVSSGYIVAQTSATDSLDRTYGSNRTASETTTITGIIANLGIVRQIAETVNAPDTLSRMLAALREIDIGGGGYTSSGYTASGYLVASGVAISDTVGRVRDVPRALSETITASETLTRLYAALRTISRTVTLTDTLNRTYGAVRTLSQTLTNSDTLARTLTAIRTITPTIAISEFVVAFKGVAGTGASRIKEATTSIFKRSGVTTIFKRSGNTSV